MAVTMTKAERPDPANIRDAWGGVRRTAVLTENDCARWAALAAAGGSCPIDLEDRASPCGGLLLAIKGDRLTGWRPEAGALTVFSEGALVLSPVVPGAPERRAIVGRLA